MTEAERPAPSREHALMEMERQLLRWKFDPEFNQEPAESFAERLALLFPSSDRKDISDAERACRDIFHDYDKNEIVNQTASTRRAWQVGGQLVADEAAAPASPPCVVVPKVPTPEWANAVAKSIGGISAQTARETIATVLECAPSAVPAVGATDDWIACRCQHSEREQELCMDKHRCRVVKAL